MSNRFRHPVRFRSRVVAAPELEFSWGRGLVTKECIGVGMILRNLSGFKIAVALCCVLALTACSKKNTPNLEAANAGLGAGASSPGQKRILPPMLVTASISWLTRRT